MSLSGYAALWVIKCSSISILSFVKLSLMSPKVLQERNADQWTALKKLAAYVTHNAPQPLSDITGWNLSDYMQLPLEPLKTLYYSFSNAEVLPKICKQRLIWKTGGVTL